MKRLALTLLAGLPLLGLFTACGPVTEGVVVQKAYSEAHEETRTHEVYKFDCGRHHKTGSFTPKYGCGTGWFDEDYTAHVLACRSITLKSEDSTTEWCVDEGVWEGLSEGDKYSTVESDYRPGTSKEDVESGE